MVFSTSGSWMWRRTAPSSRPTASPTTIPPAPTSRNRRPAWTNENVPVTAAATATRYATIAAASFTMLSPSRIVTRRRGSGRRLRKAVAAATSGGDTTAPRANADAQGNPGTARRATQATTAVTNSTWPTPSNRIGRRLARTSRYNAKSDARYNRGGMNTRNTSCGSNTTAGSPGTRATSSPPTTSTAGAGMSSRRATSARKATPTKSARTVSNPCMAFVPSKVTFRRVPLHLPVRPRRHAHPRARGLPRQRYARASPQCPVRDARPAGHRERFRRVARCLVRGVLQPGAGVAGRPVGDLRRPDPRPATRTRGQGAPVAGAHRAAGGRLRSARRSRAPRHEREQDGMVHAGGREPDAPPAATGCHPAVVAGRGRSRLLARGRDRQRLRWPPRESARLLRRRRRDRFRLASRRRLAGGPRAGATRHIDALAAGSRERPCDRGRPRPGCADAVIACGGGTGWAECLRGARRLRSPVARGPPRTPREARARHLRGGPRDGQPPRGGPRARGGRRLRAICWRGVPLLDAPPVRGVGGRRSRCGRGRAPRAARCGGPVVEPRRPADRVCLR